MSTDKEQLQDIHLGNDWQVLGGFLKIWVHDGELREYVHICASNGREPLLPMWLQTLGEKIYPHQVKNKWRENNMYERKLYGPRSCKQSLNNEPNPKDGHHTITKAIKDVHCEGASY
jgi:hypothetical protein